MHSITTATLQQRWQLLKEDQVQEDQAKLNDKKETTASKE